MTLRATSSALLLSALLTFSASAQAPLDVRVALVIGNGAYDGLAALGNPVNDATAMTGALQRLGFTVVSIKDGTREQMQAAIDSMRESLKGQRAVGMLYYAGHGMQLDWRNYMIPVNARLGSAADVPAQTVDVSTVISAFRAAGNRMNIVVLDACRDNPFADKASGKGLAQLDAPPGTFLAFATAPGNVAEDGDGASNGLYTGFLVQELARPSAKIEDVFKRVRLAVRRASNGRQIPWESTSLEDDFYFNDGLKHTFRLEDLEREAAEARRKEEDARRLAEQARERERQIAQQLEQERQRITEAQRAAAAQQTAQAREREQQLLAAQQQERERAAAAARAADEARQAEAARQALLVQAKAAAEARMQAQEKLSREEARERAYAQEKAEWDRIKSSTRADDYYEFLARYPSGLIAEAALEKLEWLAGPKVLPTPAQGREAWRPSAERWKVGDSVVMEYRDGLTQLVTRRETQRVTAIKGEVLEINGGEITMTRGGSLIRNDQGMDFDPPLQIIPVGELQIGKQWTSRSQQSRPRDGLRGWVEQASRVVAYEQVTVPAGTFQAYRIETALRTQTGVVGQVTHWVTPGVGSVRFVRKARLRNGQDDSWTRDLVSYQRVER